MKMELKPRRNTNRGDEIIQTKLDPVLLKTAEYFAKKMRSHSLYVSGKNMLLMHTSRVEQIGVYFVYISHYRDFHRDAGKALRMMIYGFIMQDIDDIIVLDIDCRNRIFNIFDEDIIDKISKKEIKSSTLNKIQKYKEFNAYTGWKKQWILSLLKTAIKYEDPLMFAKILERINYGTYKLMLQELMNGGIPLEYMSIILRHMPCDDPDLAL